MRCLNCLVVSSSQKKKGLEDEEDDATFPSSFPFFETFSIPSKPRPKRHRSEKSVG